MAGNQSSQAQLDRLRDEVDRLTREPPAAAQLASRAEAAVGAASGTVQARGAALAGVIRHRPFVSFGVLTGVGFLAGRALHRRRRRAGRGRRIR